MHFYLTFGFLGLRLLRNERWIFSKAAKVSNFRILSCWIEKYKAVSSKSYSSWDNWYCVRLVIVSLAVNIAIDFLNQLSQQLQTTCCDPKLLIFKLLNVSNKDVLSIRTRLLRSAINKHNKELQHLFIYTTFYYWLLHPYKIYSIV